MTRLAGLLAIFLPIAAAAQAPVHCGGDAECAKLGAGFQCVAQKTACAVHPESSTCVERICRRPVGWPVKEEDRACRKDADCAVVLTSFQCMYCAREGDFANGVVAAANRKRAKAYEVKPTPAQLRSCAMAGACAQSGTARPRCRARRCVVEYEARQP